MLYIVSMISNILKELVIGCQQADAIAAYNAAVAELTRTVPPWLAPPGVSLPGKEFIAVCPPVHGCSGPGTPSP